MKILIINYDFISGIAKKYPDFKTVIHRKPKLGEIWNFGDFISNGYSRIQISVHTEQHRVENSHGSYIIEEIKDPFDFIVWEVLRCLLVAEVQRKVYIDKQNRELIEQNELLFEAEFNNEVGVTKLPKLSRYVT